MTSTDFEKRDDQEPTTSGAEEAAPAAADQPVAEPTEEPTVEPVAEEAQPEPAPEPAPEPEMSMDDVDLDAGPKPLAVGDLVTGVVAQVTSEGVLVDVGGKSEGMIPKYEFGDEADLPERDSSIEVAVVKTGDDDGGLVLSKKSADYERMWNRIVEAAQTGDILDAMVTERVKGGLRVDLGVSGFVPASHVATRDVRNLDRFVGQALRLRVLEADRQRKKVVLSHRLVVEEERKQRREETLNSLHAGLVCEGKVRSIANYGAFIDIGGLDGLLHVSEMSWGRVGHPSEVCKVGDTLSVVILEIDANRDRISLGRRQILPDPWKEAAKKIRTGEIVKGKISRIVRPGAFVELPELGIEGFLPIGELADKRIENASEIISEGQEVQLKVLKLRPDARRMTLSLIAAQQEQERQEYQKYMADSDSDTVTLGDQFGDLLGAVTVVEGEQEAVEEAEEAPAAEAVAEEAVAEEAVAEEAVAEEAVAEEAVAEEAVAEEAVAEEAVAEEAVAEEARSCGGRSCGGRSCGGRSCGGRSCGGRSRRRRSRCLKFSGAQLANRPSGGPPGADRRTHRPNWGWQVCCRARVGVTGCCRDLGRRDLARGPGAWIRDAEGCGGGVW